MHAAGCNHDAQQHQPTLSVLHDRLASRQRADAAKLPLRARLTHRQTHYVVDQT
jgi:hypothetical protein